MNDIEKWTKNIVDYKLPRWDELPELKLYLDQVIEYVNEILSPIFIKHDNQEPFLTSAMINNYVKHSYIPAPIKKRYGRDHLAFIISITVLKQITNLINVSKGAKNLIKKIGKKDAYNVFVLNLEKALDLVSTKKIAEYEETTEPYLLPLKTITLAFAYKMLAEYILIDIIKNIEENKKWKKK